MVLSNYGRELFTRPNEDTTKVEAVVAAEQETFTREECEKMIDTAIDRHNKNATLISAALGSILLFFYAHGLLTVIDKIK